MREGGPLSPNQPPWGHKTRTALHAEIPRGTYFFRGGCLPLTGFFTACLAMAALGESQDEVGVFGGSEASDFWFGKGARGPLLTSLIFSSSGVMVLRIAFPVFLFSGGRGCKKTEVYSRRSVSQFLDRRQLCPKTGLERREDHEGVSSSALSLASPVPASSSCGGSIWPYFLTQTLGRASVVVLFFFFPASLSSN